MKLELDPLDLKEEYRNGDDQKISTRDVSLDKLTDKVRVAVLAVGRATFYAWDRRTHRSVFDETGADSK